MSALFSRMLGSAKIPSSSAGRWLIVHIHILGVTRDSVCLVGLLGAARCIANVGLQCN